MLTADMGCAKVAEAAVASSRAQETAGRTAVEGGILDMRRQHTVVDALATVDSTLTWL